MLFVLLGGLVDVSEYLANFLLPMLAELRQSNSSTNAWQGLVQRATLGVRRAFRSVLSHASLRHVLRHNMCVLLPGYEESGCNLFPQMDEQAVSSDIDSELWNFATKLLRRICRSQSNLYLRQLYMHQDTGDQQQCQHRLENELLREIVLKCRLGQQQLFDQQLSTSLSQAVELLGTDNAETLTTVRKQRDVCVALKYN